MCCCYEKKREKDRDCKRIWEYNIYILYIVAKFKWKKKQMKFDKVISKSVVYNKILR